eukprot:jgi/Psemu1/208203/e_gw1.461.31.1
MTDNADADGNDATNNNNNNNKNECSVSDSNRNINDESNAVTPEQLLSYYKKSKALRPLRKVLTQCCAKIVQPTLFNGHGSLGTYQNHKEGLSQVKKRKMAESVQQRKHLANTLLRKGRIEKLNAKLQEGQSEELEKWKTAAQAALMIPDGHVDTVAAAQPDNDNDNDNETTQLPKLRSCYVCKTRFRILHHFYDQLCPDCATLNWTNRHKTRDLTGKVAVVTGSRVKIGYQTCLKLLRAGCFVIATTRFPNAAVASYRAEADFDTWNDRLEIYGLDLRDVTGLELFCRYLQHKLGSSGGLDILINNACQTIRRPTAYYLPACQKEKDLWQSSDATHKALLKGCREYEQLRRRLHLTYPSEGTGNSSGGLVAPLLLGGNDAAADATTPVASSDEPAASADSNNAAADPLPTTTTAVTSSSSSSTAVVVGAAETPFETTGMSHSAAASQMILCPEDVGLDESVLPKGLSDINGQQLDLRTTNSWLLKMDQVSTPELMECMFVNAIAPFVLNSRLQPLLTQARSGSDAEHRYVVNVSAMEGKFYRYKMANHPHTNMAKSALNMMTRTAAEDLAKNYSVYMNSIDTGWINDENPLEKAATTAKVNNFQTPIDEIDAAARLLDPIFSNSKVYGKFLKDYRETEW